MHAAGSPLLWLQAKFPKHLFVQGRFFRVPMELHAATDICLMPSRDEPFGYEGRAGAQEVNSLLLYSLSLFRFSRFQ